MAPETRYAHNGDVSIAYETFGDPGTGEPLLLVMGLDFQMVWWPDAFCEQLVSQGFAVARFDNRDAGLSTHFGSGRRESPWRALLGRTRPVYSALNMLDDALAVMDALGWPSAHVMGGSMGAGLAQALAAVHPARVRSLISCMGVPADAGPARLLTYIRFGVFRKLRKLGPAASRAGQIDNLVFIYRTIASPGYPFPEQWARTVAAISYDRSPPDPTSTQRQLAAGRACKLPPLSAISAPTLVISGEADPIIKVKGGRETARRIAGSVFVSYPGMGHNLPEELWPDVVARIAAVAGLASHPAPAR
jgi:pimeloyl-ACP methyl ester carboxylesterase